MDRLVHSFIEKMKQLNFVQNYLGRVLIITKYGQEMRIILRIRCFFIIYA